MKFGRIAFLLVMVWFSTDVQALSCVATQDRIFASCNNGVCDDFLYIREVESYTRCSRRPVIETLPVWGKEVVEFEIKSCDLCAEIGIYELSLRSVAWEDAYPFSNVDEYRVYSEEAGQDRIPPAALKRSTLQSMEELKAEWSLKEKQEYWHMIFLRVLDWVLLLVASALLVLSISWFYRWQKSLVSMKWMILALVIQSLILLIAYISVSEWLWLLIAILGVFIPGIWLFQIVGFISMLRSKRSRV